MAHSKKDKGDIGLVFAISHATKQGWSCCVCVSEHQAYDFIAEKNGEIRRIQARYTTPKNNKMEVKLSSSWADRNGNHVIKRESGDFDTLAVYNPQTDDVFFIDDKEFENGKQINLRLKLPKNNQIKGIRMACDYLTLT